jgi:hypothetical protein
MGENVHVAKKDTCTVFNFMSGRLCSCFLIFLYIKII